MSYFEIKEASFYNSLLPPDKREYIHLITHFILSSLLTSYADLIAL